MPPPSEFEQIPWTDWLTHYWLPTVSQFAPKVFVKACKHAHEGHDHTLDDSGSSDLRTQYFEGSDGFTYERRLPPGSTEE